MSHLGIDGEVLVADNGSTDGSQQIAEAEGARVVLIPRPGYGAALRGGIEQARGEFVLMADADGDPWVVGERGLQDGQAAFVDLGDGDGGRPRSSQACA